MIDSWILTWLVFLPVLGALPLIVLPASRPGLARAWTLAVTTVTFVLSLHLWFHFDTGSAALQFTQRAPWIAALGIDYAVGVDGISLLMVLLTAFIMPLATLGSWRAVDDRVRAYHFFLLMLEAGMMGVFVAGDLFLFYVFWEAMLIPMYFLIGGFGQRTSATAKAAVKFLLYNLFGGLVMLAAVVGLYVVTSTSNAFENGTFDFRQIADAVTNGRFVIEPGVATAMFLAFLFAFAVKAPLWPLHRWLPDAAVQATPASAVLMMAVMDKVGTFGMLRYCLPLFPDAAAQFRPFVVALAVIGIVYGAVLAIGQTDVMRLIAYTSISHFGFIILGIFAMTSQGQSGATLYMVNHGISTAALFLIAGFLVSRRGTRAIAAYGGVQKVAPVLAGTFLVAGLATLSLPGLAPFISEFLVLIGTFTRFPVFAVVAVLALVLSAVYVLWMYQRIMTGPLTKDNEAVTDLRRRELAVVVPLIALLIGLGVYPKVALDVINPGVDHTLSGIHQPDPAPTDSAAAHAGATSGGHR